MTNTKSSLYTGVTNNLLRRVYEHKNDMVSGFTSKYKIHKLVWYQLFNSITMAIIREKQIKDMNREDKLNLIKTKNPTLKDLYWEILESLRSPE